jgi:hypothetical protein
MIDVKVQKWEAEQNRIAALRRRELEDNPFNPRIEISADARHITSNIVKHLWMIFVLLPLLVLILYSALQVGKGR